MRKKFRVIRKLLVKLRKIANEVESELWSGPSYPASDGNWTGGDIISVPDMKTVAVTSNHAYARHIAVNSPARTLALVSDLMRLCAVVAHLRRGKKCRRK